MHDVVSSLHALGRAAIRTAFATPDAPLPPPSTPVAWIVAANGIFKRGVDANLDILIRVAAAPSPIPGLCPLWPRVIFRGVGRRLPAAMLRTAYWASALALTVEQGRMLLCERQFHVVLRNDQPTLLMPSQTATTHAVSYCMPEEPVLLDLHSHGLLHPFFSATDDRDDQGLSVSAVIGSLLTTPAIVTRLNVYGHHHCVPATDVFAGPMPFHDGGTCDTDGA